ncbi:TrkA C-terminal domain-containing protein [Desulfolucanica intricata]|uniref:TrkA C-terminal domain-containing protein n=1 Tax=Desulfolucanica intricata TaxID=1285191 RepID=UPI00083188A0|nr:TrkA C-terminal domain-containing protein [Desulfolucanica intricata]
MAESNVHHHVVARYVTIAMDIATRIVRGEYREGQKLFGRSTLAGKYNVSPETIRRALTLLEDKGIVEVTPGIGVIINSHTAAQNYLAEYGQRQVLRDIQEKLSHYLEERNKLDKEISRLMDELLSYTFKMSTHLQKIEEIKVPTGSPIAGKTLVDSEFRAKTGATILAIYKNGKEIFSPPAHTKIETGDVLIIAGPPEVHNQVHELIKAPSYS